MMARGHFLSGVTAGLLSSPLSVVLAPAGMTTPARALALSATFSGLVGLGALWPDIDHKPAFISRCLWIVSRAVCAIMRALSLAVFEATCTDQDRRGRSHPHRTFTHTLAFAVLTGAATAAMTLSGVPIAWPLLDHHGRRWGTWGLRWFRAGGPIGERVATLAFSGLAVGLGGLVIYAGGAPWWTPVLALLGG
jgi:hypothetical protein